MRQLLPFEKKKKMEGDGVQRIATQISFHSQRFLFKYVILHDTSSFIGPQFNHFYSVTTFTFLLFFPIIFIHFYLEMLLHTRKNQNNKPNQRNELEFSWFYTIFSFGRFELRTPWDIISKWKRGRPSVLCRSSANENNIQDKLLCISLPQMKTFEVLMLS